MLEYFCWICFYVIYYTIVGTTGMWTDLDSLIYLFVSRAILLLGYLLN